MCAVVETDQNNASTSPDIAKFRQYYYSNFNWLYLYYLFEFDPDVILIDIDKKTYDVLQSEIYHCYISAL